METEGLDSEISRIVNVVRQFVRLLVRADYREIDSLTGKRLEPADKMMTWVEQDRRIIVNPPDEAFADIRFYGVNNAVIDHIALQDGSSDRALTIYKRKSHIDQNAWKVDYHLWTAQDGRSDYVLELTLFENDNGKLAVRFDDLHVQ